MAGELGTTSAQSAPAVWFAKPGVYIDAYGGIWVKPKSRLWAWAASAPFHRKKKGRLRYLSK